MSNVIAVLDPNVGAPEMQSDSLSTAKRIQILRSLGTTAFDKIEHSFVAIGVDSSILSSHESYFILEQECIQHGWDYFIVENPKIIHATRR